MRWEFLPHFYRLLRTERKKCPKDGSKSSTSFTEDQTEVLRVAIIDTNDAVELNLQIPVGKTCPNHGWGWATTYIEPIYNDIQIYIVTLNSVASVTKDTIKTITEITGQNFLQTKKILENLPRIVFTGKAPEMVKICGILKLNQGVEFEVSPEFPYEIN